MKKLWLLLLILLIPQLAGAAISANAIWEVRHAGSDTNGGGFVEGITSVSSKTDLAVSSGSNVNVSSAGYGFTSADIGRWITVTAGTGWTLGSYQISTVLAGVATLNAPPAAVSTTGGSFTIYYGIDYSQQNAANSVGNNISTTDLVTNGTATVTSATATFTADIVGNVVYITGGTGSITGGWYQVASYTNATTIVLDRATGLTTGTGATLNIGGALASFAGLSSAMVNNNKAFVKADAIYTTTAAITFSQGGPIFIAGYNATRGDNGRPTLQASTTTSFKVLNLTGNFIYVQNLIIDCNSLTGVTGAYTTGSGNTFYNMTVKNYGTYGFYIFLNGGYATFYDLEATAGITGASAGIYLNAQTGNAVGEVLVNAYVHDGVGSGINLSGQGPGVIGAIVSNQSGASSDCYVVTNSTLVNSTGYNCGRHGVNIAGGNPANTIVLNNILVSNGGYGISSNSAFPALPQYDGNAFYGNTSGTTNNLNKISGNLGQYSYVYQHNVILTSSPFVNASGGNFALNSTGGGGGSLRGTGVSPAWLGLAGTTAYPDFGAVQHQCSGTGNSASCVFGN